MKTNILLSLGCRLKKELAQLTASSTEIRPGRLRTQRYAAQRKAFCTFE